MNISDTEYLRKTLPYGMWTTKVGEEILFNRKYEPIWSRTPGKVEPKHFAEPEWIKDIAHQDYFFNDGTSPFLKGKTAKNVETLLHTVLDTFISNRPVDDVIDVWAYGTKAKRESMHEQ
jgi:hypothetical protein